jgi:hypothetical protein
MLMMKKLMLKKPRVTRERLFFAVFLLVTLSVYAAFGFARPLEDDESLYVLTGKAIIDGSLDPFRVLYYGHYSNPFHYIMGSPLAPFVYGLSYNVGGILLVRAVSAIFILLSVILVYLLVRRSGGNLTVSLVLVAFSGSAITLASDGFLDSMALFFLMASLYFAHGKKMFYAGVFSGLAIITKFVLVVPVAAVFIYQLLRRVQRDWLGYLAGTLAITAPFLVLYRDLVPVLINFIMVTKVGAVGAEKALTFAMVLAMSLPAASAIALYFVRSKKIAPYRLFLVPMLSVLAFQIVFLDYNSFVRHLPYAEFPAAVVVGIVLAGRKNGMRTFLLLGVFAVLNISFAAAEVVNYPSYNLISENIKQVDGKVLALNLNSFMLAKGMPLNSTADKVYSYYYFSYDNIVDSKIEEYENALKDGYFDYVTIASFSSAKYPRYDMIEALVREYYCPLLESAGPNGIDIYQRCRAARK